MFKQQKQKTFEKQVTHRQHAIVLLEQNYPDHQTSALYVRQNQRTQAQSYWSMDVPMIS